VPLDLLTFDGVEALRAWAAAHAAEAGEAWLVLERVRYGAPVPALRFAPAAEVLAEHGLVPGERAAVDADRYAVRFAPGKVKARRAPAWAEGPHEEPVLSAEYDERLRTDPAAWAFFEQQPPRYRRAAIWWVMSGKAEATRERRIAALVEACAAGERVPALVRNL
jgi:hypothetical protein